MSKLKFFLLVFFVILLIAVAIVLAGNSLLLFIDGLTLVFIPILPYLVASYIYSFREQKEIYGAVLSKGKPLSKAILKKAYDFFLLLRRLMLVSTLLTSFLGFIAILSNLESLEVVGRNLGIVFVTIFYLGLVLLAVVEPLIGVTKKKISELD